MVNQWRKAPHSSSKGFLGWNRGYDSITSLVPLLADACRTAGGVKQVAWRHLLVVRSVTLVTVRNPLQMNDLKIWNNYTELPWESLICLEKHLRGVDPEDPALVTSWRIRSFRIFSPTWGCQARTKWHPGGWKKSWRVVHFTSGRWWMDSQRFCKITCPRKQTTFQQLSTFNLGFLKLLKVQTFDHRGLNK